MDNFPAKNIFNHRLLKKLKLGRVTVIKNTLSPKIKQF